MIPNDELDIAQAELYAYLEEQANAIAPEHMNPNRKTTPPFAIIRDGNKHVIVFAPSRLNAIVHRLASDGIPTDLVEVAVGKVYSREEYEREMGIVLKTPQDG